MELLSGGLLTAYNGVGVVDVVQRQRNQRRVEHEVVAAVVSDEKNPRVVFARRRQTDARVADAADDHQRPTGTSVTVQRQVRPDGAVDHPISFDDPLDGDHRPSRAAAAAPWR